jgi:hypothetical protein
VIKRVCDRAESQQSCSICYTVLRCMRCLRAAGTHHACTCQWYYCSTAQPGAEYADHTPPGLQVVLALQLPFTLVPLIKATSSSQLMGEYSSSRWLAAASWAATALIFVANLTLFLLQLAPALVLPDVQSDSHDAILHQVGLWAYAAVMQPAVVGALDVSWSWEAGDLALLCRLPTCGALDDACYDAV